VSCLVPLLSFSVKGLGCFSAFPNNLSKKPIL
jgi:hypothetical protein